MDDKLDRELRSHLQHQVEAYVAAGMSREEAERRARLDFGGIEQTKKTSARPAVGTSSACWVAMFATDCACCARIRRSQRSRCCRWRWASARTPQSSPSSTPYCCACCL